MLSFTLVNIALTSNLHVNTCTINSFHGQLAVDHDGTWQNLICSLFAAFYLFSPGFGLDEYCTCNLC